MGGGGVSENHQGRAYSVSQVNGDSDILPTCWVCLGGLIKQTMAFASTSVWKNTTPPILVLMPDDSVPPHVSLVPFKLLPQHWSSE